MPASDHLQPYQLKLFMTAGELMNIPSADAGFDSLAQNDHMRNRKMSEAKMGWDDYRNNHFLGWKPDADDSNLYESIKKKGIQKPVELYLDSDSGQYVPTINDGNHRTTVANDINPNMYVPIQYSHFTIKD